MSSTKSVEANIILCNSSVYFRSNFIREKNQKSNEIVTTFTSYTALKTEKFWAVFFVGKVGFVVVVEGKVGFVAEFTSFLTNRSSNNSAKYFQFLIVANVLLLLLSLCTEGQSI